MSGGVLAGGGRGTLFATTTNWHEAVVPQVDVAGDLHKPLLLAVRRAIPVELVATLHEERARPDRVVRDAPPARRYVVLGELLENPGTYDVVVEVERRRA